MAFLKAKLKELRNADVRFISLVDRAATRIPFRVLKRDDKETAMGIDLMGVFKRDRTLLVMDVAVLAQKSDAATTAIREAIAKAGFKTDLVRKSEDETVVYGQSQFTDKETVMVRLSDHTVIAVEHLGTPVGFVAACVEERGFYPSFSTAAVEMTDRVFDLVAKGEIAAVQGLASDFAHYTQLLSALPPAVFAMDAAVAAAVEAHTVVKADEKPAVEPTAELKEDPPKNVETKVVPGLEAGDTSTKTESNPTLVEKKMEGKKCPLGMEPDPAEEDAEKKKATKTDPSADLKSILDAIAAVKGEVSTQMSALTTKVDGVVQTQTAQQKVLDGVVKKADDLNTTLKTTVTAAPHADDKVRGDSRVTKADDDPRTGTFDTAFIRRRR